jgi:hypothetical protein
MNDNQKKILVFLIVCIGIRTSFVVLAKNVNINYLPYLGYGGMGISISFAYMYFTKARKKGIFGDKVWWDSLRPVHAFNYGFFAYLAINKSCYSYYPLLIDVIIGLTAFLYHKRNILYGESNIYNNFSK